MDRCTTPCLKANIADIERVIEETKEQLRALRSSEVAFEYDLNKSANSLDKDIFQHKSSIADIISRDYLNLERQINEQSSQNVSLRKQLKEATDEYPEIERIISDLRSKLICLEEHIGP